jgi:hypothetical protein
MKQFLVVVVLLSIDCLFADEHWFVFDQSQYAGFYTPIFNLISFDNTSNTSYEQTNVSFALSTYERSIHVDIHRGNMNNTYKHHEQSIQLNIERADLLYNTLNHMIFIALRQRTKLETYVNCKLIDSYLLYSTALHDGNSLDNEHVRLTMEKSIDGIKHFHSINDEHYHQIIFDKFGCKHAATSAISHNRTGTIGRALIRKMQHVIEKVQRRKQRSR